LYSSSWYGKQLTNAAGRSFILALYNYSGSQKITSLAESECLSHRSETLSFRINPEAVKSSPTIRTLFTQGYF
jgi:hypothetical protein